MEIEHFVNGKDLGEKQGFVEGEEGCCVEEKKFGIFPVSKKVIKKAKPVFFGEDLSKDALQERPSIENWSECIGSKVCYKLGVFFFKDGFNGCQDREWLCRVTLEPYLLVLHNKCHDKLKNQKIIVRY